MKKIKFLESIRGISALIVLLFHLKDTTNSILIHNFLILNGKIFVDFFFVDQLTKHQALISLTSTASSGFSNVYLFL